MTRYALFMVIGIFAAAFVWNRLAGRGRHYDSRLTPIWFAGLVGALIGAKIAFLLVEGWPLRDNWVALVSGRSVIGALPGGYAGVELAKRFLNYPKTTGDLFAIIAPLSLIIGRVGCLLQGCCPGSVCAAAHWWTMTDRDGLARWPAVPAELLFNVVFLIWALVAQRRNWFEGNRFHAYLVAYGLFRFGHEFLRDNLHGPLPIGGYHGIALAVALFGALRWWQRSRQCQT